MFSDFLVVDKMIKFRDICLKYKILNEIKDNIIYVRNICTIQRYIRNKKLKEDIKKERKINVENIKSVMVGHKDRNSIKKLESIITIQSLWKGYKIRKNIKIMDKKLDENKLNLSSKKQAFIEDNIKRVLNDNNMITIELDEKINEGLENLEDERYYEEHLNEGISKIECGLNTNKEGCELCCCGLRNVCNYLYYKLKCCISDLLRDF